MAEWENIRVPARTKAIVRQISKNTSRPMYKVVAEAMEGKASLGNLRLYEIEETLIGISDIIQYLWTKKSQLNLSETEVFLVIDKMSTTLADEIERLKAVQGAHLLEEVTHGQPDKS